MPISDFLIILVVCALCMFACRVVPLVVCKGRDLPEPVERALGFIPAAAFAALVANDLFMPSRFGGDPWEWVAPLIAAALVAIVGIKTRSMAGCIVVGVVGLGVLQVLPALWG